MRSMWPNPPVGTRAADGNDPQTPMKEDLGIITGEELLKHSVAPVGHVHRHSFRQCHEHVECGTVSWHTTIK